MSGIIDWFEIKDLVRSRISGGDVNPDFLTNKLIEGDNVTLTKKNGNGNEVLEIESTASGSGTDFNQTTKTSDYTASDKDSVWADASSNTVIVTLPSPSQNTRVRVIAVDATNTVTMARNGSEKINGDTSDITMSQDESLTVESDGTNWWII